MEIERDLNYDLLGIETLEGYQALDRLRLPRRSNEKCSIHALLTADFWREHSYPGLM
jgi:hypothetical protein